MKQYIKKYGYYYSILQKRIFYKMNNKYHGLFISLPYINNNIPHKGYYNMDEEYGHWLEYYCEFKYYL